MFHVGLHLQGWLNSASSWPESSLDTDSKEVENGTQTRSAIFVLHERAVQCTAVSVLLHLLALCGCKAGKGDVTYL